MVEGKKRLRRAGLPRASFVPLYVSVFLIYGFNNTVTSAFSGYIGFLGGDMLLAGLQNSLFILLAVGLRFALGPVADRRGARALLVLGAASFLVPCLALPFCEDVRAAIALRSLQAVGLAAYHPNVAFYLTQRSSREAAARRIGLSRLLSILSLMVVPAALFPLIGVSGYDVFFLALSVLALLGFLLALSLPKKALREQEGRHAKTCGGGGRGGFSRIVREVMRRDFLPLVAMPAALSAGYGAVLVFAPAIVQLSGALPGGVLLSALSIGGVFGSAAAAPSLRRIGARRSVAVLVALFAIGLCGLSYPAGAAFVLVASACTGFGYFGATTLLVSALGDRLKASASATSPGSVFAAQQNFLDLGMVLGSSVSGAILSLSAVPSWAFGIWGVVAVAGLIAFCVFYTVPREE